MEGYPEVVQGFKVKKIKFSEDSRGIHHMLWKQHSVRTYNEQKPSDRTLFVVNVPPYCTEAHFENIFRKYGKVEIIYFHKKPTSDIPELPKYSNFSAVNSVEGFKVAYVVFAKVGSLKQAMQASPSEVLVLSTSNHPMITGMQKWHQEYNSQLVSLETLREEIKSVMEDYEMEKQESEKAAKEDEKPDEDGWVTVTSTKKKKPKLLKSDELKKQPRRKKKKHLELVKFYAFQHRQTKIDKIAQLRKKFEEDKKRINMMKASRKFKPY